MEPQELAAMESIITAFAQMGALGIMLAYMIYKENKTAQTHKEERDEWHKSSQGRTDKMTEVVEKNTTAIVQHSATMDKLCDRIEHNECRMK